MRSTKLVGTDYNHNGASLKQASNTTISSDGLTLAVANSEGVAWIYTRPNKSTSWSQQTNQLKCTDLLLSKLEPASLSLSADGKLLAIGIPSDNKDVGAVWLFQRYRTQWYQLGSKLTSPNAIGAARQGQSVALSGDGKTLAVGAPQDNAHTSLFPFIPMYPTGATWIYSATAATGWIEQAKIVATNLPGYSRQATNVALSYSGNVLAIRAGGNTHTNEVFVYTRESVGWQLQEHDRFSVDPLFSSINGYSIALCSRGATLAVGGYSRSENCSCTFVFRFIGGRWYPDLKVRKAMVIYLHTHGVLDHKVQLSSDGRILALGDALDRDNCNVKIYHHHRGREWREVLTVSSAEPFRGGESGVLFSMDGEGKTIVIADPVDQRYTYSLNLLNHKLDQKLNTIESTPQQGTSICIAEDGTTIALGGLEAVWIFVVDNHDEWIQQGGRLEAAGTSVSLSADGSTLATTTWIYQRTGADWQRQQRLLVYDATGPFLPTAVSLSSNGKIVAISNCTDNNSIGAVWVLNYIEKYRKWLQLDSKLVVEYTRFQGCQISLSGDGLTLAVGIRDADNHFSARVFYRTGRDWLLHPTPFSTTELAGLALNAEGTRLLVGDSLFALSNKDWVLCTRIAAKVYNSSLSADGNVAVIGNSHEATTALFAVNDNRLNEMKAGERSVGETFQGWSVATNKDGSIVVSGGPRDNGGVGAGWVYSNKT